MKVNHFQLLDGKSTLFYRPAKIYADRYRSMDRQMRTTALDQSSGESKSCMVVWKCVLNKGFPSANISYTGTEGVDNSFAHHKLTK